MHRSVVGPLSECNCNRALINTKDVNTTSTSHMSVCMLTIREWTKRLFRSRVVTITRRGRRNQTETNQTSTRSDLMRLSLSSVIARSANGVMITGGSVLCVWSQRVSLGLYSNNLIISIENIRHINFNLVRNNASFKFLYFRSFYISRLIVSKMIFRNVYTHICIYN